MVHQASLSSCEYPKGVNEFEKAGFTPVKSELVKPFRVKESPVQMECKVLNIIETGHEGGAANLIVCEILLMHVSEDVLTEEKRIDPNKIDLVARMGADWYCRASGPALFKVAKPNTKLGIGIDAIPAKIRLSKVLTGNNLGQLGNVEILPSKAEIDEFSRSEAMKSILGSTKITRRTDISLHLAANSLLEQGNVTDAWKVLLQDK
jgi:hypothetical protein